MITMVLWVLLTGVLVRYLRGKRGWNPLLAGVVSLAGGYVLAFAVTLAGLVVLGAMQ